MTAWRARPDLSARLLVVGATAFLALVAMSVGYGLGGGGRQAESVATTTPTTVAGTTAPSTTGTRTPSTTPSTAPPTTLPPPPGTSTPGADRANLARLTIDDRGEPPGYARDLFPTWLDLDGNGCDARVDVLIAESTTPPQVDRTGTCAVIAGDWVSIYDGVEVSEPSELDIDHMVPLAEAWRSGADGWEAARRASYANDTAGPDQLIAVTASSNRSKGDGDPTNWRPPDRSTWCWYAEAWIGVKLRWALTIDTAERDALGGMVATC